MSNAERLAAGQEDPDDDDGYQAAERTLRSMRDGWIEPSMIEMDDLLTDPRLSEGDPRVVATKAFAFGMLTAGASLDELADVANHTDDAVVAEAIRTVADDMFSNAVDDGALEGP